MCTIFILNWHCFFFNKVIIFLNFSWQHSRLEKIVFKLSLSLTRLWPFTLLTYLVYTIVFQMQDEILFSWNVIQVRYKTNRPETTCRFYFLQLKSGELTNIRQRLSTSCVVDTYVSYLILNILFSIALRRGGDVHHVLDKAIYTINTSLFVSKLLRWEFRTYGP